MNWPLIVGTPVVLGAIAGIVAVSVWVLRALQLLWVVPLLAAMAVVVAVLARL